MTDGRYDLVIKLGKPFSGLEIDSDFKAHPGSTWIRVPFQLPHEASAASLEIKIEVESNDGSADYPVQASDIGLEVLERTDERAA